MLGQHAPVPSAANAQVWLDFDGTVTRGDLLDELVARYSRNESWRLVEERWRLGLIGSRECLEQEFALLDISPAQLDAELARVRLDPGAIPLLELLERSGVPVTILSDGVETFIRTILQRAGARAPRIYANSAVQSGRDLRLVCRSAEGACPSRSAHCKCSSRAALAIPGRSCIYIGDGRSDLCAARTVTTVFAKGALAAALSSEGRPFRPFDSLLDVHAALATAWGDKA
jgi:2,3-diketo-5-methylthio-1-phosphopentane phosphatase